MYGSLRMRATPGADCWHSSTFTCGYAAHQNLFNGMKKKLSLAAPSYTNLLWLFSTSHSKESTLSREEIFAIR